MKKIIILSILCGIAWPAIAGDEHLQAEIDHLIQQEVRPLGTVCGQHGIDRFQPFASLGRVNVIKSAEFAPMSSTNMPPPWLQGLTACIRSGVQLGSPLDRDRTFRPASSY